MERDANNVNALIHHRVLLPRSEFRAFTPADGLHPNLAKERMLAQTTGRSLARAAALRARIEFFLGAIRGGDFESARAEAPRVAPPLTCAQLAAQPWFHDAPLLHTLAMSDDGTLTREMLVFALEEMQADPHRAYPPLRHMTPLDLMAQRYGTSLEAFEALEARTDVFHRDGALSAHYMRWVIIYGGFERLERLVRAAHARSPPPLEEGRHFCYPEMLHDCVGLLSSGRPTEAIERTLALLLPEARAHINAAAAHTLRTPLHALMAAAFDLSVPPCYNEVIDRTLSFARTLLEAGADPRLRDAFGDTPRTLWAVGFADRGETSEVHELLDDAARALDRRDARLAYLDVFLRARLWRQLPVELRRVIFLRHLHPPVRRNVLREREVVLAATFERLGIPAEPDVARMRLRVPRLFQTIIQGTPAQHHGMLLPSEALDVRLRRAHYITCECPAFEACRARIEAFGNADPSGRAFAMVLDLLIKRHIVFTAAPLTAPQRAAAAAATRALL